MTPRQPLNNFSSSLHVKGSLSFIEILQKSSHPKHQESFLKTALDSLFQISHNFLILCVLVNTEFENYLSLNHKKRKIHWSWFLCPFLEKKGRRIIAAKWKFSVPWFLIQHWCWQLALFTFSDGIPDSSFFSSSSFLFSFPFFFSFPLSFHSLLMQFPFNQEAGSAPLTWRCHSTNTEALNKCIFGIITTSHLALRVC